MSTGSCVLIGQILGMVANSACVVVPVSISDMQVISASEERGHAAAAAHHTGHLNNLSKDEAMESY